MSVPTKWGLLNAGVSHNRFNSSLATRLAEQIGRLNPVLQQLFLADPVGFTHSESLPAELRLLLEGVQPAQTTISVSGQFRLSSKMHVSPSYNQLRGTIGTGDRSKTHVAGYSLTYQLTPSLQLQSSLSNTLFFDSRQKSLARATSFTIGMYKNIKGGPRWLLPATHHQTIEGVVHIDSNVNGVFDSGEPGVSKVAIEIDSGQRAFTDNSGRFRFTGLNPGTYRVKLSLAQFGAPVRMTTSAEAVVILPAEGRVNFGIVNFSRLLGNVFNDYAQNGVRQADAPGLQGVTLLLSSDRGEQKIISDGSGAYEIDSLLPSKYELSVDPATLPPNYMYAGSPVKFEVKPASTVTKDIPVRALRSVSGHVYLKDRESTLVPLEGVQIATGLTAATTDVGGQFMLRDLPSGDLRVNVVPVKPLPDGLQVPSGVIRLPKIPTQVNDAVIVISNPVLLDYLQ